LSEPTAEAVGYLLNGLRRCGVEIRAKHNLGRLLSNGPRDDLPLI
jgi:biotin operon repressor